MKSEQLKLWQQIATFPLDDPNAARPFSVKLADENRWTKEETQRKIVEYKKFLFLCVTLPNGASPSPEVDIVWHLHLTYTENYWQQLCQNVLGIQLHHHPSKGGTSEKEKHNDWYRKTLVGYVETFEHLPPDDIWHLTHGFEPSHYLPRNSPFLLQNTEGVIQDFSEEEPYSLASTPILQYVIYGLFAVLTIVLLFPTLIVGTAFLIPYTTLFIALISHLILNGNNEKERITKRIQVLSNKFSPYIAAWILGGKERLMTTFLYQTTKSCRFTPQSDKIVFELSPDENLYKNPLYASLQTIENKEVSTLFVKETLRPYWQLIEKEVAYKGFNVEPHKNNYHILMTLFLMIGGIRMIEGFYFHRPFTILLAVSIAFLIAFLIIYQSTAIAFKDWRNTFRQNYKYRYHLFSGDGILWQFVFGAAIFTSNTSWYGLENSMRPHERRDGSGDGGGSCGGDSSCGGSSCSGGCGGGCGGCGG